VYNNCQLINNEPSFELVNCNDAFVRCGIHTNLGLSKFLFLDFLI